VVECVCSPIHIHIRVASDTHHSKYQHVYNSAKQVRTSIDTRKYMVKRLLNFQGSDGHSCAHQFRLFKHLQTYKVANAVVFPVGRLMQTPTTTSDSIMESCLVFPFLDLQGPLNKETDATHKVEVLQGLQGAICLLHEASVIHMDLYPCNVVWQLAVDGSVIIRLIDFDASLFIGTPVPREAASMIERNGHTHSYHPDIFTEGNVASPKYDWWLFAMMVYGAPLNEQSLLEWKEQHMDQMMCLTEDLCNNPHVPYEDLVARYEARAK
jgi:serine/threonine protein kinase